MTDEIPSEPTLAATVARTNWGQYGATLTLPDGQEHVFAGADLANVRARVLEDARRYLASQVGHPGRLEVSDPDGTWVLGIPHDGGDLVEIASAPASFEPPGLRAAAAATPASAPAARTMLLPSRPAVPNRRHRPGGRAPDSSHWSGSDHRLPLLALLAALILALVLVDALDHHSDASTETKHAQTARQQAVVRSSRQPTAVSKPKPAPTSRPANRKPTTATVVRRRATTNPTTRRAAHGTNQHRATATHHHTDSGGAPAATAPASAPVVTATPPVQVPTSSAATQTVRTAPLPSPAGPPPL